MLNRFNQKQRVSQSTQNARAFSTREPTLFREVVATGKPMRGHLSPHSFDRRLHLEIILTLDTIYLGSAEHSISIFHHRRCHTFIKDLGCIWLAALI